MFCIMKACLNTFSSGQGDCIFLCLVNDDKKYTIMVDCGEFTPTIEKFVRQTLSNHIDLLIITHIDCDHINGVSDMLKKIPDITIGQIFYNCCQEIDTDESIEMSSVVKQDIEKLQSNLPPRVLTTDGKVNMEKAAVLVEQIMNNANWNNAWNRNYIHNHSANYSLGEGFGHLIFLAPTLNEIESIDKSFAREYMRLTTHRLIDLPFKGKEVLYELVRKIVLMKNKEIEIQRSRKINLLHNRYTMDKWEYAKNFKPGTVSKENSASIAFFWECNDKRILFLGDSDPYIIQKSLEERPDINLPMNFEAIKVSHHGSKHSTTNELMNLIDSQHYFVTGGNRTNKPSLETFAKIVMRNDNIQRVIHYNNKTNKIIIDLQNEDLRDIKEIYNFQITDNNEQVFEY